MWVNYATLFLLIIKILTINAFPSIVDNDDDNNSMVVVSSETPPKETKQTDNDKDTSIPTIPKIDEMSLHTNITNRYATTLITSRVKNLALETSQEAMFSVVLPETAYIAGFIMEIDGKSYKAYVKEKEEAKQIYNTAVQSGQSAGHVAVSARDSNRFTISINLAPASKAIFYLTYEELLQRHNNQYELVLNIHPGQPVKNLNIGVYINETRPLRFVHVPSLRSGNEITKNNIENLDPQAHIENITTTSSIVRFNPNIEQQKQFAHSLGTKEENGLAGQFIVQYDVEHDVEHDAGGQVLIKDGYFVHFFAPTDLQPLPKQVVFVLDTSGSMGGIRIRQLKQAMNRILDELKTDIDIFSIVEFNSIVKVWDVEHVQVSYHVGEDPWDFHSNTNKNESEIKQILPPSFHATTDNINKAKQVVEKLNAYGGTDIKSGLEIGLKLVRENLKKSKQHQPLIVFLTDGEPTVGEMNTERIINSIKQINSETNSPIFSLSFGDGADRDFLQKISLKNYGFARHIYEAADASLQLEEFYKQISSPLLSNVTFTYVSNVTKTTKTNFPILFGGSELVVAGKIDVPSTIKIDPDFVPGVIYGWRRQPNSTIILKPTINEALGALEKLWAYLTVRQILEMKDTVDDKDKKDELTKKALDISLKYEFVTPVSSLVVVKPNDTSAVDTVDASKIPQPPTSLDRAYFSQKNYFSASRPMGLSGPPTTTVGLRSWSTPVAASYHPISSHMQTLSLDIDADESFEPMIPLTSVITTNLTDVDKLQSLKNQFHWLTNILNDNGTITTPSGDNYLLGIENDGNITNYPECPQIPGTNSTTSGICSLLINCKQVHPLLTDEHVFLKHMCLIGDIAGICCPTSTISTTN